MVAPPVKVAALLWAVAAAGDASRLPPALSATTGL
jgi:hypothetical protein